MNWFRKILNKLNYLYRWLFKHKIVVLEQKQKEQEKLRKKREKLWLEQDKKWEKARRKAGKE